MDRTWFRPASTAFRAFRGLGVKGVEGLGLRGFGGLGFRGLGF